MRGRVRRAAWLTAGALVLLLASPAAAQPGEARALFEQGLAAFDSGDLVRAESLFRRSLELRRSGSAAYNLANVLEQTGRLVEARALFAEVGAMAEVPAPIAAEAARSRAALEARIARLTVHAATPEGVEARVDGARIPLDAEQLFDPGRRLLLVQRDGATVLEEALRLREGERRTVEVPSVGSPEAAARSVIAPDPTSEPTPDPGGETGGDDAWIWVVLGVALAAVIGAGIAIGVAIGTQPGCESNVFDGCVAAGLRAAP